MLTLQRASAGSGKTYTLAKKFIWFLITVLPESEGARRRLRTDRELADSLSHIMAVTFTNKATNEMKQRIVDKLAALASAVTPGPGGTLPPTSSIDYLDEFCSELSESPARIAHACRTALRELLNSYGDFHVSTIDSFFQTVLRTFAYETELNDSYELELDSDYIARIGMDGMLEEVNSDSPSAEIRFWLEHLMSQASSAGKPWNVFGRSMARNNIYSTLVGMVQRMEKEDFKIIRDELDVWFDSHPDLRSVYTSLSEICEADARRLHGEMQAHALKTVECFRKAGYTPRVHGHRYLAGHIAKTLGYAWQGPTSTTGYTPIRLTPKTSCLNIKEYPDLRDSAFETEVTAHLSAMYAAREAWLAELDTPHMRLWRIYAPNLPYLGLLRSVRAHIRGFLEQNNTVELAETNSILRRIIGRDDTPFIYERLGTRLNHFLIDEFQDTSRLQWENLEPLLTESEARGNDNLIIGDAKQSIYRFRNADPSLITSVVPGRFPDHLAAGMSPAENTNWRSDGNIVRFNNMFFSTLPRMLDERDGEAFGLMSPLYDNAVQRPAHAAPQGYVELNLYSPPPSESTGQTGDIPPHYHMMGPLVTRLRQRGYAMRDIAFLVSSHSQADRLIEALTDYNRMLPTGVSPIEYISEDALHLGASEAVRLVISALRAITSGSRPEIRRGEARRRHGVADWEGIRCNFNFFAMSHPDLSPAEQLDAFLRDPGSNNALSDMLGGMQAVALPALVEAITDRFVPETLRDADTPFLAALQDAIAEYCQGYPSDVASFLDWWDRKGSSRSISSPDETDAVRIMTIHKSKGLEFGCVILPEANQKFTPQDSQRDKEWRWVRPLPVVSDDTRSPSLPPWLPVDTSPALAGTPHAEVWANHGYLYRMDKLNNVYVAFTRAVHELYVFSSVSWTSKGMRDTGTLGPWIERICGDSANRPDGDGIEMPRRDELECQDLESGIRLRRYSYGTRTEMASAQTPPPDNDREGLITRYRVNSDRDFLRYVEPELPDLAAEDGDDTDPRSEGNLLHAAMACIIRREDIPRAVRRLHVLGLVGHADTGRLTEFLDTAVASVEQYGWFGPQWRVMTERPLLGAEAPDSRPDRIMVSADGRHAVVVDYKFGAVHTDNRYRRQVGRYIAELRRTGLFDEVEGYLWYVRHSYVERVDSAHVPTGMSQGLEM